MIKNDKNAQKQVFLFDSSKYGKRFAFRVGNLNDVTTVITARPDLGR